MAAQPRLETTASFAVLDGSSPDQWPPWQASTVADLMIRLRQLRSTPDLDVSEVFRADLIAKSPSALESLTNFSGVVGVLADGTPAARPDIRRRHKKLCAEIKKSANPLCRRVGYYLAFVVQAPITAFDHEFMNDLRNDALGELALTPWKAPTPFILEKEHVVESAFQWFLMQMAATVRIPD